MAWKAQSHLMMASIIFQTYVQLVKNVNFPKRILKLSSERKHIHKFITLFLHKIRHPITLTPFVLKLFKRIKERFSLTPQFTQAKHISSTSIYPLVKQLIPIIELSYIFSIQLMVKLSFFKRKLDHELFWKDVWKSNDRNKLFD